MLNSQCEPPAALPQLVVYGEAATQMNMWLAGQNFQHIKVDVERPYYRGATGDRQSGCSKPDLVITETVGPTHYIGDIKAGQAAYGKAQMAKNQGTVMGNGVSTTAKTPQPNAAHWQFKPGQMAPTQTHF